MGYRVVAIDTGVEKRKFCMSLGASAFFDFRLSPDIVADVRAYTDIGAQAALALAGTDDAFNSACYYLRPSGTLILVGLPPTAKLEVPVSYAVGRCLTIKGVVIGNRRHAVEAYRLVASGKVKASYTIRGLSELNECVTFQVISSNTDGL
jgi:alcohol dehydrogenase, propanol-preferring